MAGWTEVVVTSESTGQLWNCCVWDLTSGATLTTYKGGISAPKTLALIGQDYLISAIKDKPILQVWSLGKMDQLQMKMVCPGRVTALAVSPDGLYCVAAVEEKLHIWQISSGDLLAVFSGHYQPVRCLKFTDEGSYFVSGGDDGLVLVWSLSNILSQKLEVGASAKIEPQHIWSHHSNQVTDIYVGFCGIRARVATTSLDQTCKLYELASGELLISVLMDVALTSVTMDPAEYYLFIGGCDGNIFQINLFSSMSSRAIIYNEKNEDIPLFSGHSKQVTCLSVSVDGLTLVSGSQDQTVKFWHILSRQCLRTLLHKGPITNAFLTMAPLAMLCAEKVTPYLSVQTFKRNICAYDENTDDDLFKRAVDVSLVSQELSVFQNPHNQSIVSKVVEKFAVQQGGESKDDLRVKVQQLQEINHQLYAYSVNSFLSSLTSCNEN